MKILAINGSHRGRNGYTGELLETLREGAVGAGAEFETVVLAEQRIQECLGCGVCGQPQTMGCCVLADRDDVAAIFDKIRGADLVIYGSPVYVFGLTGRLKTFMDRYNCTGTKPGLRLTREGLIFHHVDRGVTGKPLVVLTLCSNIDRETVKSTLEYFSIFARYAEAPVVGRLVCRMSMLLEKKDSPRVREVLDSYRQAGRELAVDGRIHWRTQREANRPLLKIPFLDLLLRFRFFKRRAIERAEGNGAAQERPAGPADPFGS